MRPPWPAATMFLAITAASAASPPGLLNYQGVLRDASDAPLSGTYDMVFRFYSLAAGGDHILTDFHKALNGGAVTVDGGLFNVQLGGGSIVDGAGPGTYSDLASVFRDYAEVWLEVEVQSETLSPRTRIVAAAYALNATNLEGRPGSDYLDTSSTAQTKSGPLTVDAAPSPGHATLATGNWGIRSFGAYDGSGLTGPAAGYFQDTAHTGTAYLGHGDTGIEGYGTWAGGVFRNGSTSGYTDEALLAYADFGIQAQGDTAGGYFADRDHSGQAYVGSFDRGIDASGWEAGGYFTSQGGYGVRASALNVAGYFLSTGGGGLAQVGFMGAGINAEGRSFGGHFLDTDSSVWGTVGYSTYKIEGSGSVAFVQNHPLEKDKVIVYNAPEGDEVATYTRGTARLVGGEARVALGPTFAWVTNPDIGLTAHLTPRGECKGLYVASLTTSELVVRELGGGASDVTFDYLVHGLRIGFEEVGIVQEKRQEAYIPSMADHRARYAARPELRPFSALARFEAMPVARDENADGAPSRAEALRAAIGEYDPEVHGPVERSPELGGVRVPAAQDDRLAARGMALAERDESAGLSDSASEEAAETVAGTVALNPFVVAVREEVESGDVLAVTPAGDGSLERARAASDPTVVGIVAGERGQQWSGSAALAPAGSVAECHVDATFGAIAPGDLLVTSPTPGHAMRAPEDLRQGTVVAKALEPLEVGTGRIRVLVMPR